MVGDEFLDKTEAAGFFCPFGKEKTVQFVVRLQVQPELRGSSEKPAQPDGRVRCDSALTQDYFVDSPGRHADLPGDFVLRQAIRLQKFLVQDFARMDRREVFVFVCHGHSHLMIILYQHFLGTIAP